MVTPLKINDKTYSINHSPSFNLQNQIKEFVRIRWYEVPMPEIGTIIDAGADVGVYSLYMSEHAKEVYAIEPYTPSFEYLVQNVKDNNKTNIKYFKFALAGTPGNRVLYTSYNKEDVAGYSLLPVGEKAEVVKTKTLAKFMKDEKINLVHILKTDIEGAEQEMFSADDFGEVAPKILCIIGHYHIQCVDLKEILEYYGYDYKMDSMGMFIAVRKVNKVDILLPK